MDFTIRLYKELLCRFRENGYDFKGFLESFEDSSGKNIILRHDVDRMPVNSLKIALIESQVNIKGTYYFRVDKNSVNERIIKEISSLGHEIGYHYEDMSFAHAKLKATGNRRPATGEELERVLVDIAIESFTENLEKLRKIVPVKTISMHGSPMSRWDSRLLWKYYDYRDFGIVGEPYFELDFDQLLYLTDTGRRWDGETVSIRDKAVGGRLKAEGENPYKDWKVKPFRYREKLTPNPSQEGNSFILAPPAASRKPFPKFHTTSDIIQAAKENKLPDKIMMTFHPQRWTNEPLPWIRELIWQNIKNAVKFFIIRSFNNEK